MGDLRWVLEIGNCSLSIFQNDTKEQVHYEAGRSGNYDPNGRQYLSPEQKKRARLIAAAPEMLEGLIEIASRKGPFARDQYTFACNVIDHHADIAKALLAKLEEP